MNRTPTLTAESANGQTNIVRRVRVASPLLKVLKDQKSARKVCYNEPRDAPKRYDMSLDREAPSRCVVAPVIAASKGITPQAEGTAVDARGPPPVARS